MNSSPQEIIIFCIMKKNIIAMNLEPHECVILVQSKLVGCFEDLRHFSNLSAISGLESRI